jgi:ABC-type branched-subunit amino acid transport system ATPase component
MPILELADVTVEFGAVRACDGISFTADAGELIAIVGPNGSGKTTLFRAICGDVRATGGRVTWFGQDITRWPTDRIARAGLVRTFQQSMVFGSVSVRENMRMATACAAGGAHQEQRPDLPTTADEVLAFTGLDSVSDVLAGSLPTGLLRIVGIAVALVARPALLLLDEPAAGLNAEEAARLGALLRRVHGAGATLAVVDHDMSFILPLCERLIVLDTGKKLIEGNPAEVLKHEDVVRVYLGGRFAHGKTGGQPVGVAR